LAASRSARNGSKTAKAGSLVKYDIAGYQKVAVALSETIHLMAEIDEVIKSQRSWPMAFQSSD
jgi:hypothetical protein